MKHKGIIIGSALIAILLTVAAFTVLNKRWWKRMIDKRWQYQFVRDERGWAFRAWKPLNQYSLAQLMRFYYKGDQGWFRTEEEYLAWSAQNSAGNEGPGYQTEVG